MRLTESRLSNPGRLGHQPLLDDGSRRGDEGSSVDLLFQLEDHRRRSEEALAARARGSLAWQQAIAGRIVEN